MTSGTFDYLDVSTGLLTQEQMPCVDCYGADGLHLSATGYKKWNGIIATYLAHRGPTHGGRTARIAATESVQPRRASGTPTP